MILKPQDLLVVLKLVAISGDGWTYPKLAIELGMSPAEVHAGIRRAMQAQLAFQHDARILPNINAIGEFLLHGIRYVFMPDRGEITRGVPTISAAPPLMDKLVSSGDPPPVWPDPEGEIRGQSFSPLYTSVPAAARKDKRLYELLVLVDAIRGGNARERSMAGIELQKRLESFHGGGKPEP
jgi:hypothetical protein